MPRSLDQRREAALERLAASRQLWLATGGGRGGVHLIPVSYAWNGTVLTTATFVRSRTTANIRADPRVRAAIGETTDVTMVDATATLVGVEEIDAKSADAYARVSLDPRVTPGFHYVRLVPQRIQVWSGVQEFAGRTVMSGGEWLDKPID
ncbi:MAG: pyridoxamine 5'-phosphate oxidase family protein [Nocardiopsaceae bacterium]|nr:pyridoxamine 5'-phosphate oxidase family protein [Nocardiopsaceae bacterium]